MSTQDDHGRRSRPPADLTREQAVRLMRRLREAAQASGVLPGDPLHPLVEALAQAIGFLGVQRAALSASVSQAAEEVAAALREGRETAEAEAELFRQQCAATEAETVQQISTRIAAAATEAFAGHVRAVDRKTAVAVILAVLLTGAGGFAAGWILQGQRSEAAVIEVERDLRIALRSPSEAKAWVELMQWNSATAALTICHEPGESRPQNGRLSCRVPLWIEPAPAAIR